MAEMPIQMPRGMRRTLGRFERWRNADQGGRRRGLWRRPDPARWPRFPLMGSPMCSSSFFLGGMCFFHFGDGVPGIAAMDALVQGRDHRLHVVAVKTGHRATWAANTGEKRGVILCRVVIVQVRWQASLLARFIPNCSENSVAACHFLGMDRKLLVGRLRRLRARRERVARAVATICGKLYGRICDICDHDLDRCHLRMVKDETDLAALEEHLLRCGACVDWVPISPDIAPEESGPLASRS